MAWGLLESSWRDLEASGQAPVHRRVDASHPLDLYVGLDARRTRELVLLADTAPSPVVRRFKAFDVLTAQRGDGRYALSVRLRREELGRLFAHLCDDLVEASRVCAKSDAVRFLSDRIARWEHLLSRDRHGLLDQEALRGLVAELVFLKQIAIPHRGLAEALHAWRGPVGAAHDFQFEATAVEVKSVTDTLIATISSAEQLEAGSQRLILSAVWLQAAIAEDPESFSVAELIHSLRQAFEAEPLLVAQLEDKLALVGYRDAQEYEAARFLVKEFRHFEVSVAFPRLVRTMLPPEIVSVRYAVDLRRCDAFRRSTIFGLSE